MIKTVSVRLAILMSVTIVSNAKFRTDQVTVYNQFFSDAPKGAKKIAEWSAKKVYARLEEVRYTTKCYVSQMNMNQNYQPDKYPVWWREKEWDMHAHGFSREAKKRFAGALDNFTGIFEAAKYLDPSTLVYNHTRGISTRNPSFCTLTVPEQTGDDYEVKRKMLKAFLDNIRKNTDIKMYIWKAEAQLRDEIHFHIAFDKYLHQERARKHWYKLLQKNNMLNGLKYEEASRIVWITAFENIDTMKFELAGYFATDDALECKQCKKVYEPYAYHLQCSCGNTDEKNFSQSGQHIKSCNNCGHSFQKEKFDYKCECGVEGETGFDEVYKYKHDKSKVVRKINGNQWGCSDNLRYPAYNWFNIDKSLDDLITHNPIISKTVNDAGGRKVADVHIYKQVFTSKKKVEGKPRKKYVLKNKLHEQIGMQLVLWHYMHASVIYGSAARKLTAQEFYHLYGETNWVKAPAYKVFYRQEDGGDKLTVDYEKYKCLNDIWWPEKKQKKEELEEMEF